MHQIKRRHITEDRNLITDRNEKHTYLPSLYRVQCVVKT
jgi:hypothetical protein